jgi:hypothetical protein
MALTILDPLAAAIDAIDDVAQEGELGAQSRELATVEHDLELVELPDGRRIYPPRVFGERIDDVALNLLDLDDPAESKFLRLVGPPGTGKSQLARVIAYRLWQKRGREVGERHGQPFYGFVEVTGGPTSDSYSPFVCEFVPSREDGGNVRMVDSAFIEAMVNGWTVMIDEANAINVMALLSLNAVFDGRLSLYSPAEGRSVVAAPGFTTLLAYNPGLLGGSDLPSAYYSRFPATLEVTSYWPALLELGAPEALVNAARTLDTRRLNGDDGLVWTPQFREIEALHAMMTRVGERTALALFVSNLAERVGSGDVQAAEAEAACRMLDEAGYAPYKVSARSQVPALGGYPRAVTR